MAKKAKSFAEKALGKKADAHLCPECGEPRVSLLLVNSEKQATKGNWKFARSMIKVCKCTEKEVYA